MPTVKQRQHMPAELLELIFNYGCLTIQDCAQVRVVDKEWCRAADSFVKRLKPKDLGRHANLEQLIAWLQRRFPNARILDLSRSYPCQLLLSPDRQKSQVQRLQQLLAQLSTWPYEFVLRAGMRSLADMKMQELVETAPRRLRKRVIGISLFKDYKTYLPPPANGGVSYGVRRFGDNINSCLRMFIDTLKEVNFEHIEIPTLEDAHLLSMCTQLSTLNFNGGVMKVAPTQLEKLTNLKVLRLDNCHMKVHGQAKLQKLPRGLTNLTITHSHIAVNIHPQDLLFKNHLVHLDLSHNKIGALPATLGHLLNLRYLNASHNSLVSLPKAVAKLCNLQQLLVSNNKIKFLPREIDNLYWLEVFDVSYNAIVVFPKRFPKLHRLRILDMRGNPVRVPVPKELLRFLLNKRVDTCYYDAYIAPPRIALQHTAPHPKLDPNDVATQYKPQPQWQEPEEEQPDQEEPEEEEQEDDLAMGMDQEEQADFIAA